MAYNIIFYQLVRYRTNLWKNIDEKTLHSFIVKETRCVNLKAIKYNRLASLCLKLIYELTNVIHIPKILRNTKLFITSFIKLF